MSFEAWRASRPGQRRRLPGRSSSHGPGWRASVFPALLSGTLAAVACGSSEAPPGDFEGRELRAGTSASPSTHGAARPSEAKALGAVGKSADRTSPKILPVGGIENYFPNPVLTTHGDEKVRFHDLIAGRTVLINFMFTTCNDICPLTTANLRNVQAALGERVGRDVFIYSITLEPEKDTPEVLRRYARTIGAKPGWTFLTGEGRDVEALRRKLGLYDPDPVVDANKTQHAGVVVYGNAATGEWSGMPGMARPERIARAVLRVAR